MIRLTGHPDWVWGRSPREIGGYLAIEADRRQREDGALLALHALAAQGDPKVITKAIGGKD